MSILACLAHELAHAERFELGFQRSISLPDCLIDKSETSGGCAGCVSGLRGQGIDGLDGGHGVGGIAGRLPGHLQAAVDVPGGHGPLALVAEVGDLGEDLKSLEREFDLHKAKELIDRIRRAPETTVRRIMEHFARIVDVLVFTSHRAMISSQLHIESVTESYREVQEKNKKLSDALERLQELSRLKSNFLATVSHELRTPLTSVIGYSEMLLAGLAGDLNDEQKDYLKTILEKGESLLRLISSILDLSRIEARGVQLVRKPTGLDDIVQSAMESVLPQSLKKNLQLKSEVSRTIKNVTVDSDKIRQCVVNLLSNSVKFTPAGGHIVIQAGPAERPPTQSGPFGSSGYFQISVTDNGIGIAPELQSKVFETFFQADSSASREYGGAGLGLSIVRSYVEAHGGEVFVKSELGKGSTFTLIVPIEPPGSGLEMPRN